MGCLYMATAPDGRSYIGVTRHTADLRWEQHCSWARRKRSGHLADAIRVYGGAAFRRRVLVIAKDANYLSALEVRAIAAYGTFYPMGLNSTPGGDGVRALDSFTAIRQRQSMAESKKTKQFRAKCALVQAAYWTPEKCAERATLIKEKWKDPDYRARILASRKKAIQMDLALKAPVGALSRKAWGKPGYRERMSAVHKNLITPEYRAMLVENQKRAMTNPETRLRIALSLNRYRDCVFKKGGEPKLPKHDRGGLLQDTIPQLPEMFSCADAVRLGWMGREFDRALDRGWIIKVSGDVR